MTTARVAVLAGAGMTLAALLIVLVPLRLAVGPDLWSGGWSLGDQFAYGQLAVSIMAIGLAGGVGWYAVKQYQHGKDAVTHARAAELIQLHEALQTLQSSLDYNHTKFVELRDRLADRMPTHEAQLDVGVWEAVRLDVAPHLHMPALAAYIARHFAAIESFALLLRHHYKLVERGAPSDLEGYLNGRINILEREAIELKELIAGRLAGAAPAGGRSPSDGLEEPPAEYPRRRDHAR